MEFHHERKFWIEKTIVKNRKDRIEGERALGRALWSPQKDRRGGDVYKNMCKVNKGDIIIHLIDNQRIIGLSKAANEYIETDGLSGTAWEGPAYLIKLEDFIQLDQPLDRGLFLNEYNRDKLMQISKNSEVFYNRKLELRQGAYLTPCPKELVELLNQIYIQQTGKQLPHTDPSDLQDNNNNSVTEKVNGDKNSTTKEKTINNRVGINHFSFGIVHLKEDLRKAGLMFEDKLIERFVASIITKPFVILTGLSGSGKTKLAQAFATWICASKNQYCIVPVGSDWTNREPLLGFPNALSPGLYVKPDNRTLDLIIEASKEENQSKPYFLILDEMNLSHVERYFADFLSVIETGQEMPLHNGSDTWEDVPPSIGIPKNLYILGTVNIDETTYMFSPKVLDRANVVEFRVTNNAIVSYLNERRVVDLELLTASGARFSESLINLTKEKVKNTVKINELNQALLMFFNELVKIGAEYGHRTANEISLFAYVVTLLKLPWKTDEIVDIAVMQKLLPKVHGSRRKLEPVLKTLGQLCLEDSNEIEKYLDPKTSYSIDNNVGIRYLISFEKILRMYRNLIQNGFTSYAEA